MLSNCYRIDRAKPWFLLIVALFFYVSGISLRRYVLDATFSESNLEKIPFTLESALQFRRIAIIDATGTLPSLDVAISQPEGNIPSQEYTVFVDFLAAKIASFFPKSTALCTKLRWFELSFYSISIPLLFLWGWKATSRVGAGVVCASMFSVSISALQRSTGAELTTENTSFPFLILHFFCQLLAAQSKNGLSRLVQVLGSALSLALAVASWDLMQFYVLIWAAIGLWNIIRDKWSFGNSRTQLWMAELSGLIILSMFSTYHRSHALFLSPAILASLLGVSLLCFRGAKRYIKLWYIGLVATILLFAAPLIHGNAYCSSYGHFSNLFWAKINFLNVKPFNPVVLTFDQRLMWTPALHSPTVLLMFETLGSFLLATMPASFVLLKNPVVPHWKQLPLIGYLASVCVFVLFFRFHVFVSLFGSMLLAVWWGEADRQQGRGRYYPFAWMLICIFLELFHTLSGPWSFRLASPSDRDRALAGRIPCALWGARAGIYYDDQIEMTDWLSRHASPDTVLAGFGISGAIAAYGKCGIVLHPKFETKLARDKVKEFAEQLFKGSLVSMRAWADSKGASYFVYSMGAFDTREPTLQLRYMVDSLSSTPTSPARLFEDGKYVGPFFREVFSNRKYKVFKILTYSEESRARASYLRAKNALERGAIDTAEREATDALYLNPFLASAEDVLRSVELFRARGLPPINE